MNKPAEAVATKAVDSIQERLTSYACDFTYEALPAEVIHAAKVRVIDTLGALMAGFFGDPCSIARKLAAQMLNPEGATVIGTRLKATLDTAAFVNATTARYVELNDNYNPPGSFHGHPSDVITPLLAVAEHAQANGRDFITSVVLAYEVYLRINDLFHNKGFAETNHCCLAVAIGAGKLLGLTQGQLAHCISMAIVPNVILRQVKRGHISMFKAAASGQAGRAGVYAALLAQAGMEGPHLPFEGKAGWCDHVALERFSLDVMGGNGTPFKILETKIKLRPSFGFGISSILAAEEISPFKDLKNIKQIIAEVNQAAKERVGPEEVAFRLNPQSKESADHSIPYLVAATLMDGTVTLKSYDDTHLWNPELRGLLQKVELVANPEFTKAYGQASSGHRARVTVVMNNGERFVGESGGGANELSSPKTDAQIAEKFGGLARELLGEQRVQSILDSLWRLDELSNVAQIPSMFAIDSLKAEG